LLRAEAQQRQRRPYQNHRGHEVDVESLVDTMHREVDDRSHGADPGIRDQSVHRTKGPRMKLNELRQGFAVRHVGRCMHDLWRPGFTQLLSQVGEIGVAARGDGQPEALASQAEGNALADATGGTGD
jgi:hypothetical protein